MSESPDLNVISHEQRNLMLLTCEKNGDDARRQLDRIQNLFDRMLELAQDCYEDAESAWEVAYANLTVYDEASERLLADTAARVKSLEARLRHLKQDAPTPGLPHTPEDIASVEEELLTARLADQQLISERLEKRRPVSERAQDARRELLAVGVKLLGLSYELRPALLDIEQAGDEAARLRNLPLKAEGQMRRRSNDAREVIEKLEREPEPGMPSRTISPLDVVRRKPISVPRRMFGGADVHADSVVTRTSVTPGATFTPTVVAGSGVPA